MYNIEHRDRIKSQISPFTNLFSIHWRASICNSTTVGPLRLHTLFPISAKNCRKTDFRCWSSQSYQKWCIVVCGHTTKTELWNWGCCTFNSMSRDAVSINMLVSKWQTINSVSNLSQGKMYDIQQMFWLNFEISAKRIRNEIRLSD